VTAESVFIKSKGVVTSRHAREVPFEVRTKKNPRPETLEPEDVARHALRCRGHLSTIARRWGYEGDAIDAAIDLASRVIETGSYRRYDPTKSSIDSWLAGAAMNYFRKAGEVRARRERILRENFVPSSAPPRPVLFAEEKSGSPEDVARFRRRLTPSEADVFDLSVRVGPRAPEIARALGWAVEEVRGCLRRIRDAAGFVGLGAW